MDDRLPDPQPAGALVPPPIIPRTALATATPQPPRRPSSRALGERRGLPALLHAALDRLDRLGDRIAEAAGLR